MVVVQTVVAEEEQDCLVVHAVVVGDEMVEAVSVEAFGFWLFGAGPQAMLPCAHMHVVFAGVVVVVRVVVVVVVGLGVVVDLVLVALQLVVGDLVLLEVPHSVEHHYFLHFPHCQ